MKLTTVVNYMVWKAMCKDPKSSKKRVKLSVLFMLLGSVYAKAARKPVGEIDYRGQFHQCFMHSFYADRYRKRK